MTARTLIALLLAAATGCVDNNASVRISAACFPPTPSADGSCMYPQGTCGAVWMDNLWVDTTYAPTGGTLYWPFQADNERPSNTGRDGGTNTATAFVTGYKIAYTSGSVSIPTVTVDDTTRMVESASSQILSVPVVPPSVATLLTGVAGGAAQIKAEIRATGHYGDGQTFETGPFSVVVFVENGRGVGTGCSDPAKPTLVAVCPQAGQSGIPLCQ